MGGDVGDQHDRRELRRERADEGERGGSTYDASARNT